MTLRETMWLTSHPTANRILLTGSRLAMIERSLRTTSAPFTTVRYVDVMGDDQRMRRKPATLGNLKITIDDTRRDEVVGLYADHEEVACITFQP